MVQFKQGLPLCQCGEGNPRTHLFCATSLLKLSTDKRLLDPGRNARKETICCFKIIGEPQFQKWVFD